MDAAKFCLSLMIATLLATAGCSDSFRLTAEDGSAEAVLVVEESMRT